MGSAVLVVAGGWSAGVVLGALFVFPLLLLLVSGTGCALAAFVTPSVGVRLLAIGLVALLLGAARGLPLALPDSLDPLAGMAGDLVLTGRVLEAPIPRGSRYEIPVEVERVRRPGPGGQTVAMGEPRPVVLVRALAGPVQYGDRVEALGRLAVPRSRPGWPLREILARRGIAWVLDTGRVRLVEPGGVSLTGLLTSLRHAFETNTRALLPEPHASLVTGIVFGSRSGLPPELRAALSTTGTSHLTAVSGANVAMVAGALLLLGVHVVGRRAGVVLALVGVWLYTIMVGAPPSAVRAAWMASFALAAHGLGRQPDAIVGLALAVAVLLGWDPALAFDLGFQLSVAATAGLVLLTPSIERPLRWLRPGWVRDAAAVAIAAQIATLPIVLVTFQRLSIVSVPANVLVAPLIPLIMAFGVGLAALGWLPGIDLLVAWGAWLATELLLQIVDGFARVPGAVTVTGRSPGWLPLAWYLALGAWVAAGSPDARALGMPAGLLRAVAALGAALILAATILLSAAFGRAPSLDVVLLDVEPSAAFVRTPAGRTALVTTAEPPFGVVSAVAEQLELWETTVDVTIGPSGVSTGVDLALLLPAATSLTGAATTETVGAPAGEPARLGTLVQLEEGISVLVVDQRIASERPVLDLAVQAPDFSVLLPGPGTPSTRWADVTPNAINVARLPSSAVTWARQMPPRRWLLLVGEPSAAVRADLGLPFVEQRQHGAVSLSWLSGTVSARTERCEGGTDCVVTLPSPILRTLTGQ